MAEQELPAGWRKMTLGDLLPKKIIQKLPELMNQIQSGQLSFSEGRKRLSALLEPEAKALLDKGVLKDYLVLVILNQAMTSGSNAADIRLN